MRARIPTAILLAALSASSLAAVAPAATVAPPERVTSLSQEGLSPEVLAQLRVQRVAQEVEHPSFAVTLDVLDALPDFEPILGTDAPDESSEETGTYDLVAVQAEEFRIVGDLQGDGHDDAFAMEFAADEDGDARLVALDGRDGSLLWELEPYLDWWAPYRSADLSGDGVADLLMVSYEFTGDCDPCDRNEDYEGQGADRVTWTFLDALDGSTIGRFETVSEWSGLDRETESSEGITTTRRTVSEWTETASPAWLRIVGDQDGDGSVDVLVSSVASEQRYERESTTTLGLIGDARVESRWHDQVSATVRRLDGSVIADVTDRLPSGYGWVTPLGSGSDAPSALLYRADGNTTRSSTCTVDPVRGTRCTTEEEVGPDLTVGVLEPRTFTPRWELDSDERPELANAYVPWDFGHDVTGDGRHEILLEGGLRDGADGELLDATLAWDIAGALGEVDGRVLALATEWYGYEVECGIETRWAAVERYTTVDAATGAAVSSVEDAPGDPCEDEGCCWFSGGLSVGADVDGDGYPDLHGYDWMDDTTTIVSSLGATLLPESSGYWRPVGDVDGDGLADAAVYSSASEDSAVEIRSITTKALHWRLPEHAATWSHGDVDGDGLTDLAVARWHEEQTSEDTYRLMHWDEVVRGADGALRWATTPVVHHGAVVYEEAAS